MFPASPIAMPDTRVVPFDQVVTFDLTGKRDNTLSKITIISVEGPFVAVAIGYSILPEAPIEFGPLFDPYDSPTLGSLSIGSILSGFRQELKNRKIPEIPESKFDELTQRLLRKGLRINPRFADQIFKEDKENKGSGLSFKVNSLGSGVNQLFQAAFILETEVSFLYSLFDNATGREFQSEAILNIAGLGLANGDRPFRYFPKPILFAPRSALRVQINEISGRGRLYIVLQGYKVLGGLTGR